MDKIPSQLTINLKEENKDMLRTKIMREEMANMWSTEDLLVRDER